MRALHVTIDSRTVPELKAQWERYAPGIPLIVVESPYRSLREPVMQYVDEMCEQRPEETVTVIVPEAVATRWDHRLLQENLAARLKSALGRRRNVILTNMRYFLD